MEDKGLRAYVAEFIGTFVLVATITMIVTLAGPSGNFVLIGLVHALMLMMLVYTLGPISGAHFNPAVTVALASIKKIKLADAATYILLQLAAGVLGALFTKAILTDEGKAVKYGLTSISSQISGPFPGLVLEAVFTFLLVWAIVGVAVNTRAVNDFAGWVIGATLGFAVMIDAPLTGAGLNPARSFGPAVVSGDFKNFWLYVVGPVVGGLVAALLYNWLGLKQGSQTAQVGESKA